MHGVLILHLHYIVVIFIISLHEYFKVVIVFFLFFQLEKAFLEQKKHEEQLRRLEAKRREEDIMDNKRKREQERILEVPYFIWSD